MGTRIVQLHVVKECMTVET